PAPESYPLSYTTLFRSRLGVNFPASVGAQEAPLAMGAAGVVLEYLEKNQVRLDPGLFRVRTFSPETTMHLDAATVRNLELPALRSEEHTSELQSRGHLV